MRSVTRRRVSNDESPQGAVDKLVAAFEQLLAKGESFTTISIEALTREAGLARATFYLHFRNKGELVRHLMRTVEKKMRSAASTSLRGNEKIGREELTAFMRQAVEIQFQHRAALRAMIEVSAYDEEVARVFDSYMTKQASDTRVVMSRLQSQGLLHPDVNPLVADVLSWGAEVGCLRLLKDDATPADRRQLADTLTHIVWRALARPPPAAN